MTAIFDAGLQPERTALAWRRTGLSPLGGFLIETRILPGAFGSWAALIGLVGVVTATVLLVATHRRYRVHHEQLTAFGDLVPVAGGRLAFCLVMLLVAGGTVATLTTVAAGITSVKR